MKKLLYLIIIVTLALSGCSTPVGNPSIAPEDTMVKPGDAAVKTSITHEDNIYFILIDRFYDAVENLPDVDKNDPKAYQGGDIRGIIEKLDYIRDLGMTAIWISPVMDNAPGGYHGYWIHDFYAVDEHFGTIGDFKELVEKAHALGMKVILDYVFNHTGPGMAWLDDPAKQDWFHEKKAITNWNDKDQLINGWIYGLPDLNQENPLVRDYLVENALWWIEETGIDGFRIDTARHVPDEFLLHFIDEVKSDFPEFYLLGEVWHNNARILKLYQNLGFDGVTNYSLYNGIIETFGPYGDMRDFAKYLRDESLFTDASLNSIFIDNHDNPRFYSSERNYGKEYTGQALAFLFTYPAAATLYYGTEALLEGEYDPVNRTFMPWASDGELVPLIKELALIKSLYVQDFEVIAYGAKYIAYKTEKDGRGMLVAMNSGETASNVEIPFFGKLRDYRTGETIEAAGTLSLVMGPVSTRFFIIE
ncbi:MAG: alpha-amylase [Clostridia bacterium]|nr:alpha-amylase [Clostridia bacterium]